MTGTSDKDEAERTEPTETSQDHHVDLDTILRGLASEAWRERRVAAQAAAQHPNVDEIVSALLDMAAHGDPDQKAAASDALVEIGDKAAAGLAEALASGNLDMPVRRLVVEVLGNIGSVSGLDALEKALRDEDVNVRMSAAEALGAVPGRRATDILLDRLAKDEFLVTSALAEALWKRDAIVHFEVAAPLLEDRRLVRPSLKLLGTTRDARAIPLLVDALASRARPKRSAAILATARFLDHADEDQQGLFVQEMEKQEESLAATLAWALHSDDPQLQWAAMDIATVLSSADLMMELLSLWENPDLFELAIQAAATILAAKGLPEEIDPGRLDPRTAQALYLAATQAIQQTGARLAGQQRLLQAARHDVSSTDQDQATAAAALLGEIGEADDLPAMVELAAHTQDDSVGLDELCAAIGRLGRRHPTQAVTIIEHLDDDSLARILPQVAAHMTHPGLGGLAARLYSTKDPDLRLAGLQALAHLPDNAENERILAQALEHPDPMIRAGAARALPGNCSDSLLRRVAALLEDPEPKIRRAACFGLGRSNRLDAADTLVRHARSGDDPDVLAEAVTALTRLGGRLERSLLDSFFSQTDIQLAKAALEAARTGEPDPLLARSAERLMESERWDLRVEALRTYCYHAPRKEAEDRLMHVLGHEQDETVLAVAKALLNEE